MIFVFIGTQDYHFMINKNIDLLRRVYPGSRVVVYDWGDWGGNPSGTEFPNDARVIPIGGNGLWIRGTLWKSTVTHVE